MRKKGCLKAWRLLRKYFGETLSSYDNMLRAASCVLRPASCILHPRSTYQCSTAPFYLLLRRGRPGGTGYEVLDSTWSAREWLFYCIPCLYPCVPNVAPRLNSGANQSSARWPCQLYSSPQQCCHLPAICHLPPATCHLPPANNNVTMTHSGS